MNTNLLSQLLTQIRDAPDVQRRDFAEEEIALAPTLLVLDGDRAAIGALASAGNAGGLFLAGIGRADVAGGRIAALVLTRWARDWTGDGQLASRLPAREGAALVNGLIDIEHGTTELFALGVLRELGTCVDQPSRWALEQLLMYLASSADGHSMVERARSRANDPE